MHMCMLLMQFEAVERSFSAQNSMDARPVALTAASSSISTGLLWLLRDLVFNSPSLPPLDLSHSDLSCPEPFPIEFNFWVGLILGLCLWPLLELIVLGKQWLTLILRVKTSSASTGGKLYRVL